MLPTQSLARSPAARLGFWAAALAAGTFVVFAICFEALFVRYPPYFWDGIDGYAAMTQARSGLFRDVAQLMMLLFGPLLVVAVHAVEALAPPERRFAAGISRSFAVIFAALTGVHYFVQLSVVRQNVAAGRLAGMDLWVQANPGAPVLAINMLGMTLFLGLTSLFLACAFAGATRLERVIRGALLANAAFCLLGGVGFVLELTALVFVTMNLGLGAAVLVAMVGLAVWMRG